MTARALVELDRVSVAFGGPAVLEDLTVDIESGSYHGVVGPSGAGKTTLLRAVMGTVRPSAGSVRHARGLTVGYVPQVESVDWNFPVSVAEVVAMGFAAQHGFWPRLSKVARAEIGALLERLGLAGYEDRHSRALSGGQQQRVFIARALIRRPGLLVLDEPTSGVDVATRRSILDLLDDVHQEGTAVLLTTHDLNSVAAHLPHLVCLNRNVVAHGTPEEIFTPEVLERTFGSPMAVVEHEGHLLAVEVPDKHMVPTDHHLHVHHAHPSDDEAQEVRA